MSHVTIGKVSGVTLRLNMPSYYLEIWSSNFSYFPKR